MTKTTATVRAETIRRHGRLDAGYYLALDEVESAEHTPENFVRVFQTMLDHAGTPLAAACRAWISAHHDLNETKEDGHGRRR